MIEQDMWRCGVSPIIYILMFSRQLATREIAAKPNLALAGLQERL